MKMLYYFKYFYFISKNWNPWLGAFTVYHEISGEKKYAIDTIKINRLHDEKIDSENLSHASIYQASNYYLIEKAFEYLKQENVNHALVDFGCGRGRILVVAAHYGFKAITGIDFSTMLCIEAEANVEKISTLFPGIQFEVICADAASYQIRNYQNCFFFFNPFDEVVLLKVVKNILDSIKKFPRKIYVIYLNPVHKEVFLSAGFEEEYFFKKMEYLEFCILSKSDWQNE
ncbi:class I SAM-dependent methyltransferase [Hanamia caeni]|jgi:SAM-dependent methyltransferase|uniref:Class I SAM-dependent methyltransferase n=1 Tax=Hanamia caeni TaxID=2294116 RepID=A0A3M9N8Y9_9BACT|nr:class I SAM-dependent methyltransferase [Hanamia caeni]RNI34211.1 class I SAM-dependent methyltransferase [Hanamia caeni]